MKIRNDSPFAKLTQEQGEMLLDLSKKSTIENLVEAVKSGPNPLICSVPAMRRFLRRVEQEQMVLETEDSAEAVGALAKNGENPSVREATLATVRQRMFEQAFETKDRELLIQMFRALNEEKTKERALELEERKIKAIEENAKLGWRKLECENARTGLKLLPKIREILMDASKKPEGRVAEALTYLGNGGGQLLVAAAVESRQAA